MNTIEITKEEAEIVLNLINYKDDFLWGKKRRLESEVKKANDTKEITQLTSELLFLDDELTDHLLLKAKILKALENE